MDGALHTDFTKSETSGAIKTIILPYIYLFKKDMTSHKIWRV